AGPGRPGCARGEDEVLEVVRDLVLSGRRGYPPDRGRLDHLPAAGEALGARRSAIPRNEDRGWGQSAFRGIGPRPQALEQRRPYPSDFQGRLHGCGAAILQPSQLSEDLSPSGRTHLQVSRGVQGLVPEPRPRECSNDIFKLWRYRSAPPGRDHSRAWHVRAARLHLIILSYCASGERYIRWSYFMIRARLQQ